MENENTKTDGLPKIDESLGELLCDECEGRGCLPSEIDDIQTLQSVCWKCQGAGKVDWVSHIMGVAPPSSASSSGTSMSSSWSTSGTTGVHDDAIEAAATALAAKIDEEILDSIVNDSNKYSNFYSPGGT